LHIESSFDGVSLLVLHHARVGRLVRLALHVLDDKGAVGEDLLLPVDGQVASVALPGDGLDRVPGNGAGHHQRVPGHDRVLLHGPDEGHAVHVDALRVLDGADLGGGHALVEAAVVGLDGRDVEVRHDVAVGGVVLPDVEAVLRRQVLAVQEPGDVRSRVARGDALEVHRRPGLEGLRRERVTDLRRFDCKWTRSGYNPRILDIKYIYDS